MKKTEEKQETPRLTKPEDLAFHARQIMLSGTINAESAHKIIEQLIALNHISKENIIMRISSMGGSITDGLAIIDTLRTLQAPVITYIIGHAYSMGIMVAITGNLRVMSKHAIVTFHPSAGGSSSDYYEYQKDRFVGLKLLKNMGFNLIKKYTKLNKTQLDKIKNGELWLTARQCLKYGVVDKIV